MGSDLIIKAVIVAALVAVVAGGAWALKRHYIEEGKREVQTQWDKHEAEEKAETARIESRYKDQVAQTEVAQNAAKTERAKAFDALQDLYRLQDEVAHLAVPQSVVERLLRTVSTANRPTGPAEPAAKSAKSAAPATGAKAPAAGGTRLADPPVEQPPVDQVDMADLVRWADTVAEQYAECRDQVIGWMGFYSALQQAQRTK